jgi:hypothetical protein
MSTEQKIIDCMNDVINLLRKAEKEVNVGLADPSRSDEAFLNYQAVINLHKDRMDTCADIFDQNQPNLSELFNNNFNMNEFKELTERVANGMNILLENSNNLNYEEVGLTGNHEEL